MAIESAREQVSELAHSAKDAAQQTIGRQKDTVASNLGEFARALRDAGRDSGGDGGQGMRPVAEWAADGLERVSSTLRTRDLNSMLRSTEDFARRQPLVFFLGAAAAGFLAARFLKAGMESTEMQSDQSEMQPDQGDMRADEDTESEFSDASPMAPM